MKLQNAARKRLILSALLITNVKGHKHDQQGNIRSLYFKRCYKDLYFYRNHVSFHKDVFISICLNLNCQNNQYCVLLLGILSENHLISGAYKLVCKMVDVNIGFNGIVRWSLLVTTQFNKKKWSISEKLE